MAYTPGDFFIGVIDFFGILVPGAVLLFLHRQWLPEVLGLQVDHDRAVIWAVFLVGSYVLGQFLNGIGVPLNYLLRLYRRETKDIFYNEVKDAIELPPGVKDWKKRTEAFHRASAFMRISNNPSALAEVERQMADYKLFRGLTVVFVFDFLFVWFRHAETWPRLVFSVILLIAAASRFLFLLDWTYRITFEYYGQLRRLHPGAPSYPADPRS